MNFSNHGYMGNTWRCKTSKDFVDGSERSFSWGYNRLPMTLSPHVTFTWLVGNNSAIGDKMNICFHIPQEIHQSIKSFDSFVAWYVPDVIIMWGSYIHNSTQILTNSSRGATIWFVSCSQLSIRVGSPGVKMAFVRQCHRVSIPTNDLSIT